MSFIAANQNFINIKLKAEMKGLSDEDKFEKYSMLRPEIINRLRKSREISNNLSKLYIEAFDVIGYYAADLLLFNVLFEETCVEILDALLQANIFSEKHWFNGESIVSFFDSFLINKHSLEEKDLNLFLRDFLVDKIGIFESDWVNANANVSVNPIVNHYSNYLVNSFKNEYTREFTLVYIVFVKVWNTFASFSSPFNNTKAILLYNAFNKEFNEGNVININYKTFIYFRSEIDNWFNSLIFNSERLYLPFRDSSVCYEYSTGYLKQRDTYFQIQRKIEELYSISTKDDYLTLITKISQSREREIVQNYKSIINKKLEAYEYPSSDEIEKIRKIELSNKYFNVQIDFFNKIYLY